MPVRCSKSDQSHEKMHEGNVKLLIALCRALDTDAKTPTHVRAVGVKNVCGDPERCSNCGSEFIRERFVRPTNFYRLAHFSRMNSLPQVDRQP